MKHGKYASKLEAIIFADAKRRKLKVKYEPNTFPYLSRLRGGKCGVCGSGDVTKQRRYTPDILLGDSIYIEIKGKFTGANRQRMEDFIRSNPEIDLRFIFARDNWITKKHKSKYSDWAIKNNLKFHIGFEIPEEWIK